MIPFTSYLPEVLPYVPGCPRAVAMNAIRKAVIELCQRAHVWRHTDTVSTVIDQGEYQITIPDKSKPMLLKGVAYNGRDINPITEDELDRRSASWRSSTGSPQRYLEVTPNLVRIYPIPDAVEVDALSFRVVLKPSRDAIEAPDHIYDDYSGAIAAGALSELLMQTGKPWAEPKASPAHGAKFEHAVAQASMRVRKSHTTAKLRVAARPFA